MTRTSNPSPSPAQVLRDLDAAKRTAKRVWDLADKVATIYEEALDAGHRQGSGEGVPMGKNGFRVSDPTGDVATSGLHAFIRAKVKHAAHKLRRVEDPLEEVERILGEAFSAYDPEHRQRMERLREIEQTAIGYGRVPFKR